MSEENEIIGEFTVQPVQRAIPCTGLPPMVVRVGKKYAKGTDAVIGMCVLLDQDGKNNIEDVIGENGVPLESIFDANLGPGLQCQASTPIADSKLTARSGGSGGGSSSSSGASSEEKSIYFAFNNIAISWAGTYRIGVYIWIYPTPTKQVPNPEARVAGLAISEQIEIADGDNPDERPTKEERRVLNRMRHTTGMAHFNIPHQ
ncbi:hypothetical protein PspLS_09425 [Pyricularia sp. CBS 133598]|nr:hypothetical protein PspLS_09425 [Pyricularia sp. CBS 133598]